MYTNYIPIIDPRSSFLTYWKIPILILTVMVFVEVPLIIFFGEDFYYTFHTPLYVFFRTFIIVQPFSYTLVRVPVGRLHRVSCGLLPPWGFGQEPPSRGSQLPLRDLLLRHCAHHHPSDDYDFLQPLTNVRDILDNPSQDVSRLRNRLTVPG